MEYPPLTGLCKDYIYKCFRCEDPNFIGVYKCRYAENKEIKENFGVQERMKI